MRRLNRFLATKPYQPIRRPDEVVDVTGDIIWKKTGNQWTLAEKDRVQEWLETNDNLVAPAQDEGNEPPVPQAEAEEEQQEAIPVVTTTHPYLEPLQTPYVPPQVFIPVPLHQVDLRVPPPPPPPAFHYNWTGQNWNWTSQEPPQQTFEGSMPYPQEPVPYQFNMYGPAFPQL
jgi:hypothetical protein